MKISFFGVLHLLGFVCCMSTGINSASIESAVTMQPRRSAVIVGGGPSGLAASLLLEKCGWDDVTIVEKRSKDFFESSKAYLYLIDGRGQKCTNALGTVMIVVCLSVLSFCKTMSCNITDTQFPIWNHYPVVKRCLLYWFYAPEMQYMRVCDAGSYTRMMWFIYLQCYCSNVDPLPVGLTERIAEKGVMTSQYPGLNEVMPTGETKWEVNWVDEDAIEEHEWWKKNRRHQMFPNALLIESRYWTSALLET